MHSGAVHKAVGSIAMRAGKADMIWLLLGCRGRASVSLLKQGGSYEISYAHFVGR
jgi:hypothetical protein